MTSAAATSRRTADLARALIDRDLRISYGGAVFGLLWAPATVIVQVGVLAFVFVEVVPLGVDDYAAFLFTGLAIWHLVSSGIGGASEAFTGNRDLVRRPGFPDVVLPLVTIGRTLASYLLGLPVLAVVLVATGRLGPTALSLPLVVLAAALVATGPALVVATLHVRHRDVGHLVRVLLGVLFYATPVFYAEDRLPDRFQWVGDVNPLAWIVGLHRQVLYEEAWPDTGRLLATAAVGLTGALVGVAVYRRADPHLADDL